METTTTSSNALATAPDGSLLVEDAYGAPTESFEQFCLMAGIGSLTQMMNEDMARLTRGGTTLTIRINCALLDKSASV